jgi:hypothetical protein
VFKEEDNNDKNDKDEDNKDEDDKKVDNKSNFDGKQLSLLSAQSSSLMSSSLLLSLRWHSCCAPRLSFCHAGWLLPVALPLLLASLPRIPLLADYCVCRALPWWSSR